MDIVFWSSIVAAGAGIIAMWFVWLKKEGYI
jgi:hypothetical protein